MHCGWRTAEKGRRSPPTPTRRHPIPRQCLDHGAWAKALPIKEVLQLMRKERWRFPVGIELEYPVPAGATRIAEVSKCLQYCKDAFA